MAVLDLQSMEAGKRPGGGGGGHGSGVSQVCSTASLSICL
jgi:hypothetical protein